MSKKMYAIPAPYDYHEYGEVVVLAENEVEALELAKRELLKRAKLEDFNDNYPAEKMWKDLEPSRIREVGSFYLNKGCDC